MAMAAAMRFGGGALLRRTPVAEARRRLAHTTPEEMREVATRAAKIDKTKEELFDMVIDLNSNYNVPHSMKRQHLLLSQRLSSQIQPRPYDPAWRFCRRTERRNTFYKFLGVTTSGLLGSAGLFLLLHGHHHRPKKWVVDWWDKLTS